VFSYKVANNIVKKTVLKNIKTLIILPRNKSVPKKETIKQKNENIIIKK
jgi:hypothetical protein